MKTSKELAKELRVEPKTLANWRTQGKGPAYLKMHGVVMYEDEDVKAWKDKCKKGDK